MSYATQLDSTRLGSTCSFTQLHPKPTRSHPPTHARTRVLTAAAAAAGAAGAGGVAAVLGVMRAGRGGDERVLGHLPLPQGPEQAVAEEGVDAACRELSAYVCAC